MGGDPNQEMVLVADSLHQRLHQVASIVCRLNGTKCYSARGYNKLSVSQKNDSVQILLMTTKIFDVACQNVSGYNPIYPTFLKVFGGYK